MHPRISTIDSQDQILNSKKTRWRNGFKRSNPLFPLFSPLSSPLQIHNVASYRSCREQSYTSTATPIPMMTLGYGRQRLGCVALFRLAQGPSHSPMPSKDQGFLTQKSCIFIGKGTSLRVALFKVELYSRSYSKSDQVDH